MTFTEAIRTCFQKYATFSGRARRSEFWWFVLLNTIVSSALGRLALMGDGNTIFSALESLWSLALFSPSLAVAWRRLHDIGKSGSNWFWCFLPIVGWIMLIVWYARPGVDGANQYGPDPKNPDVVYTQEERPPWEN